MEHETGPEILATVAEFGHFLEPFLAIAAAGKLVADVALWLRKKVKTSCDVRSPERHYHDARFLRVEMRYKGADGSLRETVISTVDLADPRDDAQLAETLRSQIQQAVRQLIRSS
ncbi:MAG: hypothetical protein QOH86_1734 [Sphingomonadales bacterium]|nr:hypothetical protein [Sphingomonadales bacterium]